MPILKQLVAGGSQTKRRSRMDLTTEMISAPLGDFRHTMHVGRSGEAFGDTSFLSTRSGEPPRETEPAFPRSPKPGLLARTFRSSKRSQSMNRSDQRENTLAPPDGSPTFVKNAMSLPFLNESDGEREDGGRALKSLTSSPMRQAPEASAKSSNGALATAQMLDLEQHEQLFGVLTDLRSPGSYNGGGGGGMKKAESVMSFHVDLGPSMLGDILDVMEKEDDDQGFEEGEGKGSEGRASPPLSMHTEGDEGDKEVEEEQQDHEGEHREEADGDQQEEEVEEDDEEEEEDIKLKMIEAEIIEDYPEESDDQQPQPEQQQYELDEVEDVHDLNDRPSPRPPSSVDLDSGAPYTPELHPKHLQNSDSCSMSSCGSAALAQKPPSPQLLEVEAPGMTRYSPPPPVEEGDFSSFIEDEDDEIRV